MEKNIDIRQITFDLWTSVMKLAVTKLLSVSISKKFIPSIINIVGTDLSNYKIVRDRTVCIRTTLLLRNGEKIYCLAR